KFSGATEIIISSQKYIFEFKNMKKCFILLTIVRKIEIHLNQSLKNFLTTINVLDTKIKMKIVEFFSTFQVSDVARDSKISKSRASKCLRELATNRLLEIRKGLLCKKAPNRLAGKVFEFIKLEERLIKDLEKEIREILKVKPFSIAIFSSYLYSLKLDSIDVLVIIKDYKNNVSKISSEPSEIFGIPISILLIDRENFKSNVKRSVFPLSMLTNHRKIYGKDFGENGMVKDEKERVMFELSKIGCWLKR
ncbi:MAG: hypothetical protein NZ893_02515, partial [Candidatus Aenigmarchaeota archaeon]|nr:hypothetical protein [Candidatus Aenigmarchaeota archaeon]